MAKTFSITEKTTGPANVQIHTILGGSLSASTTYYYKIVAKGAQQGQYYVTDDWLSVPSAEASVTTTVTNKTAVIVFDDNVAGVGSFLIYRTKTAGNYDQTDANGVWQLHLVPIDYNDGVNPRMANDGALSKAACIPNGTYSYPIYEVFTFTSYLSLSLTPGETITATNGAKAIVITDPAGGTSFKVRNITGSWTGGLSFTGGTSGNSGAFNTKSARVGWCVIDNIADGNLMSCPLFTDGLPSILFKGGTLADPITPQDMYEWAVTQGKTYCMTAVPMFPNGVKNTNGKDAIQFFQWRCNVMQDPLDPGPTYFKFNGHVMVNHLWGKFLGAANCRVDFGDLHANGYTYNGACYVVNKPYALYSCLNCDAYFYASYTGGPAVLPYLNIPYNHMMSGNTTNGGAYWQYQDTSRVTRIWDSVYQTKGRLGTNYDLRRSRIMSSGNELTSLSGFTQNCTVDTHYINYNYNEAYWKDMIYAPFSSYDAYVSPPWGQTQYQTCIQHFVNPTWARARNALTVYASIGNSATVPCDCLATEEYEVDITVINEYGSPIQGATIQLTDNQGKSELITSTSLRASGTVKIMKNGTTINLIGGAATVGAVYRIGLERVKFTGSNTIIRGYDGTTPNYIGGTYSGSNEMALDLVNPYLTTNSSGVCPTFRATTKCWSKYDCAQTTYDISSSCVDLNPMNLTVTCNGYETYKGQLSITSKSQKVITLRALISKNLHSSVNLL